MVFLNEKNITLRTLETSDLEFLFQVENDEEFWSFSTSQQKFSREQLSSYIENAKQDIQTAKQYRFLISNSLNERVGLIDLFDFDERNQKVGIGILILPEYQRNKYGHTALKLVINYAFTTLNVRQLYANIESDNQKSIGLFEKCMFSLVHKQKDRQINTIKKFNKLVYHLTNPLYES